MHGERSAHDAQEQRQQKSLPIPCKRLVNVASPPFFVKDGRRISVDDCALFQAGKTLPYVGIIRKVDIDEEGAIQLAVNWLYRSADVKVAKAVTFETAPNELFYSFHQDSISSVSLLHPCKVAFLRKGVELPLGISSFVCRRVYDIANKRLWWLTDRDYTDEHQEEVDKLLDRTKLEMQAAVQSGVSSPRALTGKPSCQQTKPSSDNVPSSALSTAKNKKRERTDQNSEPSKRERSTKSEDSELLLLKRDHSMKVDDIWAIVEKDGGLFTLAGVDKLVGLMQQERNDGHKKAADVASRRVMLAGVIAATENEDCLNRFVQLGGLPMLDDWLQDAHKGKFGDGDSPKEGEKILEDLLLILLRALDKLPVDLDALKTCIVGKSVNNLRSHKNYEIQKKARKLVDIWKKRVDAEMKQSGDVKPGASHGVAWPSKQSQGDLMSSYLGKNGVPSDVSQKTSSTFTANVKAISNGSSSSAEATTKAMVVASVMGKASNLSSNNSPGTKDSHLKASNSCTPGELSSVSVKEERSSCSSQSQNYEPSWSSAPLKGTMNISWKDDPRNSSVNLLNSKASGVGLPSNGKGLQGCQKEISGVKPLVWSRNAATNEKPINVGMILEKGMLETEAPSNQRLIVRLPNPGRSPARSASSGSMTDSPVPSRGSSPNMQERHATTKAAEMADGKSRLHCNTQTEVRAEAISEPRSSTGGKCRTAEGDAKLKQLGLSEDKNGSEMAVDHAGHAAGNCSNGEEPYLQNGKQVAVDNSCISTVSAQKSSPEPSTEADSSWKGKDSTILSHDVIEDVSPAVDATTVDNGAMSILATIAASQDVISTETDARGADREHAMFSTVTSLSSPGSCERARNGAKYLGKDPEAVSINLPSGKSTSDGIDDSQKDGNLMHQVSCLEGEGKTTSNQQGALKDPAAAWESSPCSTGQNSEKVSIELCNGSICGEGSGDCDAGLVALDNSMERRSMLGENITSDLDGLSGRVPEEIARKGKETNSGYTEEDDHDVARKVAKELEQEMEKYNKSASGNSTDLEMQDVKSKVFCGSSDKKCVISEYTGLDHPCDANRENPKNKEHLHDLPQKLVTHSIDSGRKLDEVNVGNSSDFVQDDEGVDPINVSRVDSKAIEATSPPFSVQNNLIQSTIKNLYSASECEGCSSASVQNNLNLSARSPQAGDSDSPEQAVEKARCEDAMERPIFDLNEGLEDIVVVDSPPVVTCFSEISTTTVPSMTSNGLTAPIAVIASTNGAFIPPASPLRIKKELGWKGSAATSAFRPAEPRRTHETQLTSVASPPADSHSSGSAVKQARPPLDIDLNVVDDQSMEDAGLASFGSRNVSFKQGGQIVTSNEGRGSGYAGARPDLDLNRADDSGDGVSDIRAPDMNGCSGHGTPVASRNTLRDFDLNDGPTPSFEEAGHEEPVLRHVPARSTGLHMMPGVSGFRMNGEMQNVTPWFPPGNSFSAMAIPAFAGSRSDPAYPPQSFLNAGMCVTPFNNELYRAGASLSSTPAVAFPTAPPGTYPYSAFSFGSNFPLTSASFASSSAAFVDAASVPSFPSVSSQVATPGAVAPTFLRPPFLMSLPEAASVDNNGVWGRLNLDLNAGPEPVDTEAATARHPFIMNGQPSIEDQMRSFRQVGASGAALKRKELEGGLELYRSAKHAWR